MTLLNDSSLDFRRASELYAFSEMVRVLRATGTLVYFRLFVNCQALIEGELGNLAQTR
jgi:hypothetical protein